MFGEVSEISLTYVPRMRVEVLARALDAETKEVLNEETTLAMPYATLQVVFKHPGYVTQYKTITLTEEDVLLEVELDKEV